MPRFLRGIIAKHEATIMAYVTIHTSYGLQRLAQAEKTGVDEKNITFLRYEI
ncbi:hypothetical protein NFBINONH_00074 [Klebsiella phage KP13-2]|uniref:Uncharacterized protein n=1 Tax=Klebsiella phage KP13-2 TaxID=2985659 RepID=A0AAX3DBL0_9CAUD|nr:hypothetical protein NFBINONH_00074 [Klebsiella phage KP13-2]